jgi:hypothetical protein
MVSAVGLTILQGVRPSPLHDDLATLAQYMPYW